MKVRNQFLLLLSIITGAVRGMEIPASAANNVQQQQIDLFEKFNAVANAIIGKARTAGKELPDNCFNNNFVVIFTTAIKQVNSAQLTDFERNAFKQFIAHNSTFFKEAKELSNIINAIKRNKNLIKVITKIIGDDKAQAQALTEAFKQVGAEYASQEQIAQIIGQVVGHNSTAVTQTATNNNNNNKQSTKSFWEDSSDEDEESPVYEQKPAPVAEKKSTNDTKLENNVPAQNNVPKNDEAASFALAWEIQQEQMRLEADFALARQLQSEQPRVQPTQPPLMDENFIDAEEEQLREVLRISQLQSQQPQQTPATVVVNNDKDDELQRALQLSRKQPANTNQDNEVPLNRKQRSNYNNNNQQNTGKQERTGNKEQAKNSPAKDEPASNQIECSSCLMEHSPKEFVMALSEYDRQQMLTYIRSDKTIEIYNPGITKRTQTCMHTVCKDCKQKLQKGYKPEGEENQNVLIKLLCPTCDIRKRESTKRK